MATISIVTASYNAASTLADCLRSVECQTFGCEHIIIDGGSTDGTLQVAKQFSHVQKIISERDSGIYDAMNKGVAHATGDVIGILNADDLYHTPEVLSQVAKVFEDPAIDCCYGDLVYVSASDTERVTRYWRAGSHGPNSFLWGWMPPHPTFFVRRQIYDSFGPFSLNLGSAADYELMLRVLHKHKITSSYIPEIMVRMRGGGVSNASFANRLKANRMDRRAWEVNGLAPLPWTLQLKPLRKLGQFLARPRI